MKKIHKSEQIPYQKTQYTTKTTSNLLSLLPTILNLVKTTNIKGYFTKNSAEKAQNSPNSSQNFENFVSFNSKYTIEHIENHNKKVTELKRKNK